MGHRKAKGGQRPKQNTHSDVKRGPPKGKTHPRGHHNARPHALKKPAPARAAAGSATPTHWGSVADWYDQLVGDEGSEYHRQVIFPNLLRVLALEAGQSVVDVACGQGVFCRVLHEKGLRPTGVDAAVELIQAARQRSDTSIPFYVGDARELTFLRQNYYDAATCVLAIQNIDKIQPVFEGVARALAPGGKFALVMMHPCFRGPKYTFWGWDEEKAVQYRRVDRYLLPRKEPIVTHPGLKDGSYTWSFHRPIGYYVKALRQAGLLVDAMEEWTSHKVSAPGPRAGAENAARNEIPMFLAIRAVRPVEARPESDTEDEHK